jgi:rRNA maturation protein Nop10
LNFGVQSPPCTAPSVQASGVTFSNITQSSADIQWTSGNGAARIVYLSTSSTFTPPTNGVIPSVNTVYSGGQQCVYHGTGSGPVTVTGLNPSTAYYAHVFEYCAPDIVYNTTTSNQNPNGFTTTSNCTLSIGSNSPVCSGGSSQISLTASPVTGASYSWTGPNGFTSSVQNPVISGVTVNMAGTYYLTMTAPCGTLTDSLPVQVIQGIQNPGISGNSPLCSGGTLQMSSSFHTGATYSWTGPGGFTALGLQVSIPQVNTAQSGIYTLTLSVAGCPSSVVTYPVQVNTLPVSPAGSNSPVCTGSALQLSSGSGTGVTYAWSGPSGYTSSQISPVLNNVTTSESGVYSLVMSAPGCGTSSTSVSVVVGPSISTVQAGSNTPVCTNGVLRLSATVINGAQYLWSGPQGFTSTSSMDSIVSVGSGNSGVYTLQVSSPGCIPQIRQATVQVSGIPTVQAGGNGPFCSNGQGNLLLTATPVAGGSYTWSGPNGFTSTLQNPGITNVGMVHAGRYTVVVSTACGTATDSVMVVVNPALSIPQIQTNSPICTGSTLSLSVTPQPGATFQWQGPNGYTGSGVTVQRTNSQVSFSGTYTVTASIPACPSTSGVTTVVVSNSPVVTALSNSPVCTGTSLQLSASTLPNAQYAWSGPNGFTASSQYPVIPSAGTVNAGMYYLTATTSCGSIMDSVMVAVSTAPSTPVISTNAPVCSGGSLGLSSNLISGATYSWAGPGGFTASGQFVSRNNLTVGHSGNYSLTVAVGNCPTASNQVAIQVLSFPVSIPGSNSPVCSGSVLFLTASTVTGGQYQWTGPNGFTSGAQNPSLSQVSLSQAGNYTLTVVTPGCGSSTSSSSVQIGNPVAGIQVSSNTPVCQGGTLVLSAQQITGASYLWNGPLGYSSSQALDSISSVSVNRSGVYTLSASSPGCSSVQQTLSVSVNNTPNPSPGSNSPVCSGAVVQFSANSISGGQYSWSGPLGFSSVQMSPVLTNANPSMSGIYTLVVTVPGCGVFSASTSVTVSSSPGQILVNSNSPVCQGGVLGLSASSVTGVSYNWSGPGGYTASGMTVTRTNIQLNHSGGYTLTASAPGCPATSVISNVTVNPTPNPGAGSNSPVCIGSSVFLSSTSYTNAGYLWQGPNGYSSTQQSPSISNAQPGISGLYSLTLSLQGCGSISTTTSVTVSPSPTQVSASTNSPVCSGGTLHLSSTPMNGMLYQWTGPGGYTSGHARDSVVNATISGVYTLVVSAPGCTSSQINLPVTISPSQTVSAGAVTNPLCEGGVLFLTANSVTGASYTWSGPNGFSSTQQNPTITSVNPTHAGVYSVFMTQPGCGANTSAVTIIVGTNIQNLTAVSNSPVCMGNTLQMSIALRTGVTYNWTGPNGFTSNQNNVIIPNVVQATAGNYTLVMNSPGCASASTVVKVIVSNPGVLTAGNNGPICAGGTLNLTASGLSTYTYQWTGPSGYFSTLQNPFLSNVQTAQSGVYSLITTVPNCGTYSMTTTVQIGTNLNGVTITANSPVCEQGNLSLSGTTVSGASYLWNGPNGFTSASQYPVIMNVGQQHAGTYSLTYSTPGCNSVLRQLNVIISPPLLSIPGSNTPVCQGGVVYFTGNSVTNAVYNWSGPNGFVSTMQNPTLINVQPVSSGTYSLTITQTGCGSVTGTTVVQIGQSLSNAQVVTNNPVCVGNTLNLSVTNFTPGTILWTGPAGFTSGQQFASRTPVQAQHAGIYTVDISSPGCGTITRTSSVTVSNVVVMPGSNGPICQGSVLQLSANSLSGATYTWSGPMSFGSGQQNPSISNAQPTRSGVYTLSVNTPACGVMTATTSVVVGSTLGSITVTGNSPSCVGGSLNLSVTNRTGFTFLWNGPNGFTSTLPNPVISPVQTVNAGRYSVTVTSAGCGSTTVQSVVMTVNNPGSVTAGANTPVCRGQVIYFTGTAPTGSTYSWSGPASFASTSQNPSRSNAQLTHSGIYTMNATVPACGVVSATVSVTVINCRTASTETAEEESTEGIPEVKDIVQGNLELEVYPNPTEGLTRAKVKGIGEGSYQLMVLDVLGHTILMQGKESKEPGSIYWDLDFRHLAKGVYLIKVKGEGIEIVERVVVR